MILQNLKPMATTIYVDEYSRYRVLIAEDSEPFRWFIRSKLESLRSLDIICEVSDGAEAVKKAKELQPDLVLLDVGLPSLNGIAAAQQIRRLSPQSRIVFVSLEASPEVVHAALRVGGSGYVAKTAAGTDLHPAIEAALQNSQFVTEGLS